MSRSSRQNPESVKSRQYKHILRKKTLEAGTMEPTKREVGIDDLSNSRDESKKLYPAELRQVKHKNRSLASRNGLKSKGPQKKKDGQRCECTWAQILPDVGVLWMTSYCFCGLQLV